MATTRGPRPAGARRGQPHGLWPDDTIGGGRSLEVVLNPGKRLHREPLLIHVAPGHPGSTTGFSATDTPEIFADIREFHSAPPRDRALLPAGTGSEIRGMA